jgi:glycosyltransferase involved in cell wall biosynthesis
MGTTSAPAQPRPIPVTHIASGDAWGGAEAQVFQMARVLGECPEIELRVILLNPGLLAQRLKDLAVELRVLDESRSGMFALERSIRAALRDAPPRILHTHRYKENILGAWASRRLPACARVQTVHGLTEEYRGWRRFKFLLYRALDTAAARRFHRVIAVSDDIRRQLAGRCDAGQLVTLRNAIDTGAVKRQAAGRQRVRREFGIPPAAPLVGTVGRLVPVKDYDLFLEMAGILRESTPSAVFMIVGDGPLRPRLEALANRLGLAGAVHFAGFREDAAALMSGFDLFVLSSRHEGIPLALLEAMALGLPAVVPRVGGLPEVVRDQETGFLVPPGDAGQLASACGRLLGDESQRRRIGALAAEAAEAEFSLPRLRQGLLAVYRECLSVNDSHRLSEPALGGEPPPHPRPPLASDG